MIRFLFVLTCFCLVAPLYGQTSSPVQLSLDTSEANQALNILHKTAAHQIITQADWQTLFATVPYQWLKERETAMGVPYTDDDFKRFLTSSEALAKIDEWDRTLVEMKRSDMTAIGDWVLVWLPRGATIHARVFAEIKPKTNSFVWRQKQAGPAIFLYLDGQSKAKFENTVAHECHHIGLESLGAQQDKVQAELPSPVKLAMQWMSAFGEGEAMLAAAGDDDRHPHWEDDATARARWDGDLMHFNTDLIAIQQLLIIDILDGKLRDDAAIMKRAAPFWGEVRGAWDTVGYEMAVLVDKQDGRQTFNECLLDPRTLLIKYNEIAAAANAYGATLATWSPELLSALSDGTSQGKPGSR